MPLLLQSHACGPAVLAWTPNEASDIARLTGIGIDGVITDVPDLAREIVDRHALRDAA